ncbi:MAG: hypothetical protein SNJ82_08925 [Gemmataceae bacterium]
MLQPLPERLVILGEAVLRDYPVAQGKALLDCAGKMEPIRKCEKLSLTQPYELFQLGQWSGTNGKWSASSQSGCNRSSRCSESCI